MDPFLEGPIWWGGVHHGLITFMWTTINALLPAGYRARLAERLYVVQQDRDIYPDVFVAKRPGTRKPGRRRAAKADGVIACDPPHVLLVEPMEVREGYIDIVRLEKPSRVVTSIELLSPSNKTPGNPGREQYLAKQRALLASQTSLLEIDLLRQGAHTVAAPQPLLTVHGYWCYLVSLHRGGEGGRFEVWTITLQQRLPRIPVPLADGDPDVVFDLQALFDRVFDEGEHADEVDYQPDPTGPLGPADAEWVDALLRQRGLRRPRRAGRKKKQE
jgi:hypothetical protein